jgi:hypothetical protein
VPDDTASRACKPGTISPAENGWIWKRLSVASAIYWHSVWAVPKIVSSDFGKLDVRRHLTSGMDCATAGAATAVEASAAIPPFNRVRRCM